MARVLQPCGTPAAYMRHKRAKEQPCPACRKAWTVYYQKRGGK